MRLVAGVLALTLFAPFVRADETAPPRPAPEATRPAGEAPVTRSKILLRVVRVMPESRQALLFDRGRSTHVLAEVGGTVDGYTVEDIDDDQVTLSRDGKQLVLAAPQVAAPARHPDREGDAPAGPPASAAAPAKHADVAGPVDPYGDAPVDAIAPGTGGVRVAQAPGTSGPASSGTAPAVREVEPGADGVRVAAAPAGDARPSEAGDDLGPPPPGTRTVRATDGGAVADREPRLAPAFPEVARPAAAHVPPAASSAPAPSAGSAPSVSAAPSAPATVGAPPASAPPATVDAPSASFAPAIAAPAPSAAALPPAIEAPALPTRSKAARARPAKPTRAAPLARSGNKQTADALGFADVLSSDSRSPRAPAGEAIPAAPPEPAAGKPTRPAARPEPAARPAVVPSETRTADATLSRAEVDAALADFSALAGALEASFSSDGLAISAVADHTIFQRAGLKAGDVITAVDGVKLRGLDDAANLYARAATARAFAVQILRTGQPVTLHVVVQ